ncbi:Putative Adenosinetriphosphatase [Rhizopus microsporus]|nr:Putative Adenosinetriphosphatase [Rhizopus microsporus]
MIPCISRSTKLINTGIKTSVSVLRYASRNYITRQEDDRQDTNNEHAHFWEPPSSSSDKLDSSKRIDRDFEILLETLFDESLNTRDPFVPSSIEPPKRIRQNESIIEKKLLDLVKNKVYKPKAPLPKSISSTVQHATKYETKQKKPSSSILDEIEPFDYNWYKDKVTNDIRIKNKEKELQLINAIAESQSIYEPLTVLFDQINQESYPDYYHKVIKAAIDYTSKKDPYLTLSIFEQVKEKSIKSYVSGCTADVYNAILLLRWEAWKDVYGMLDLLEEMSSNGIAVNNETRNIVRMAVNELWDDLKNTEKAHIEPVEQPKELSLPLLPFQKYGVGWMIQQESVNTFKGGILADEMGMGKTIQTISLLLSDKKKPNLVVAPTVAVMQWKREIETHTNNALSVHLFHGSKRTNKVEDLQKYDVVLSTCKLAICLKKRHS